jgi:O-antigen ligase
MQRLIAYPLVLLCWLGLVFAWVPDNTVFCLFEVAIFALTALWLVGWALGRVTGVFRWHFAVFAAMLAWGGVQFGLHWTVYPFATQWETMRWATYFCIFFLAVQCFDHPESRRLFRVAFGAFAITLSLVSTLQYFSQTDKVYWVFTTVEKANWGPFYNRDHYATFIALVIPVLMHEMRTRVNGRWFFPIAIAVLYASCIAGASRAGFVLITLEIVILFFVMRPEFRIGLSVVALIVAMAAIFGGDALYERLHLQDPYSGRRELAQSSVEMIESRPLTGWGLGTWTQVYPAHAKMDIGLFANAAHNDWLQWAADGGLPYLAMLAVLFLGALALTRTVPWSFGIAVALLHSGIDFPMQGRFLPAVLFLLFGVAVRSRAAKPGRRRSPSTAISPSTPA